MKVAALARFEEVLAAIDSVPLELATEEIPIQDAWGLRLAEDVLANIQQPPFTNSAMDGFAVGSEAGPWRVIGESAAGSTLSRTILSDEAVRIFTGAPTPPGTIAVIAQEDAWRDSDFVQSKTPVRTGRHIRVAGEELAAGTRVLSRGDRIGSLDMSLLAAVGIAKVRVYGKLRVSLISTGTELVEPGMKLGLGQIYDSNALGIAADMASSGLTVVRSRVVDSRERIGAALANALAHSDVVITIGGVSAGDHDHVTAAARDCGVTLIVEGASIKPGKPVHFGRTPNGQLWFGLPGNPMSAWTTYLIFARRALGTAPPLTHLEPVSPWPAIGERDELIPIRKVGGARYQLEKAMGSHSVGGLQRALGIARLPAGSAHDQDRGPVEVWPIRGTQ